METACGVMWFPVKSACRTRLLSGGFHIGFYKNGFWFPYMRFPWKPYHKVAFEKGGRMFPYFKVIRARSVDKLQERLENTIVREDGYSIQYWSVTGFTSYVQPSGGVVFVAILEQKK